MKTRRVVAAGLLLAGGLLILGRGYLANVLRRQRVRMDPLGDGHFGADRGDHQHEGTDLVAEPGEPVFSPISGVISGVGYAYANDLSFRLVEITGGGKVADLMYVLPLDWVRPGAEVSRGEQVGYAQAVSTRYGAAMLDHIHVELRTESGELLNPERHLRLDLLL